ERLARRSFGVTQPAALLVTAVAALVPVLAALAWTVRGAGNPLVRTGQGTLPAYVAAEGTGPDRARTLVVAPTGPGAGTASAAAAASGVGYALLRDRGPRVGDAEVAGGAAVQEQLAAVVADLAGGRGTGVSDRLAGFGVRYVLLARPADPALARTFDAVPGLSRLSAPDGAAIWKVGGSAGFPAARLRLVAANGATTAVVPSTGPVDTEAILPAAAGGERRLVLAERTDPGWRATVDGTPLAPVTVDGWAQGFVVPPGGGRLRLWYDAGPRHRWLLAQGGAVAVLALLALPARRRSRADEEGGEEPDAAPPDEHPGTASPGRRRRSR
ncbi:MAG: family 2 glycosyl transferase, partial [Actinomycetota bacterium]